MKLALYKYSNYGTNGTKCKKKNSRKKNGNFLLVYATRII